MYKTSDKKLMNYTLFFTLFLADVVSKKMAVYYQLPHLTYNKNLALGIPANNFLLYVCPIIAAIFIYVHLLKINAKDRKLIMAFFLSGGLSNMIDRISGKGVVDFIPFFDLFIFNFADFYLTIAQVLMVIVYYKHIKEEIQAEKGLKNDR